MEAKKELAFEVVKILWGEKDAKEAQLSFENTFQERKPTFDIKVSSGGTLAETIAPFTQRQSISNAKELIKQRAVDVNGKTSSDPSLLIKKEDKIKVGSRTFLIACLPAGRAK
ncbi:hypothetical protein CO010_02660 [Candidatus Shapirobacteria bacterium CG_4_8_14_3_um_filter_39_11]|uniref:RNA-binding S4 domain-containing protein n=2 Tax=Microgenomates group TaxID=1794810 RepID=A0A2M8GGC6_9BACT|nr:MAG: hypothetical protein CO010_02660 [Candidatus Shapirobacteria bacterium CG_4_8_14_3_um_filter_39_11]